MFIVQPEFRFSSGSPSGFLHFSPQYDCQEFDAFTLSQSSNHVIFYYIDKSKTVRKPPRKSTHRTNPEGLLTRSDLNRHGLLVSALISHENCQIGTRSEQNWFHHLPNLVSKYYANGMRNSSFDLKMESSSFGGP